MRNRIIFVFLVGICAVIGAGNRVVNLGSVSNGMLTDLVAYYKFDEASGAAVDSHTAGGAEDFSDNNSDMSQDTTNKVLGTSARGRTSGGSGTLTRFISSDADLKPSGDFTWAGWFRPTTLDATARIMLAVRNGTDRMYALSFHQDQIRWVVSDNGSTFGAAAVGADPVVNTFYFVACGWGTTSDVYWISVNGGAKVTQALAGAPFPATASCTIMAQQDTASTGSFGYGQYDELGLWARELSDADIDFLYGLGTPPGYESFN